MRRFALTVLFVLGILVFVPSVVCAGYPYREGTVAYWNFDEGSGTVAHDVSGNGNNGTIYGATWTNGKVGNALSFDGVDDYVEVPDSESLRFKTNYTITFWSKRYSFENWSQLISKTDRRNGWQIYINGKNNMIFEAWNNGTRESVMVNRDVDDEFNFYTIVITPSIWKVYVNGEEKYIKLHPKISNTGDTTGINMKIGSGRSINPYFHGIIDEVRICNRVLSQEEIIEDYKSTKSLFLKTNRTNYTLGDILRLRIELNYTKENPPVYARIKLELKEPVGEPDVLFQTKLFPLLPGFNVTKILKFPIPQTFWIPEGEYAFKATLTDSLGREIDSDVARFYVNDTLKVHYLEFDAV